MFRKINILLIPIFSLIITKSSLNLSQNSQDFLTINEVTNRIIIEEQLTELNIIDYEILYDIESNPTYLYIQYNKGYAISSRDNGIISEYSLNSDNTNYRNSVCSIKMYAGPLNYICQNSTNTLSIESNDNFDELVEKNKAFLSISYENNISNSSDVRATTASWTTTIPVSRMQRYSSGLWRNNDDNYPESDGYPKNGICGTISSAGLLAYYDDYVNNDFVPNSIRTQSASTPENLITTLYTYIDEGRNGTTIIEVPRGINLFLQDYSYTSTTHRALTEILTFNGAKSKIDASRPVVVGMAKILGSTYGDHWVLAYQYYDDTGTSNDKYRVVDNQGAYAKTINVSWTTGLVYIAQ